MRDPTVRGKRVWTSALTLIAALAILGVAAPAANAAFGITNVSAKPTDTAAGANSDFKIGFNFQDASADVKSIVIHLPPGLVGNPLATSTCTETQLNADNCPAASKVGTISNDVDAHVLPSPVPPVQLTASGNIFNVVPRAGEPARFGFVLNAAPPLTAPIILQSPASLRASDFGLDTTLNNIPNTSSGLSIDITGVNLTLKGKVGSPAQGFLRNPTSCGVNTVTIDATAYNAASATGQDQFTTTNCGALPFSPQFSARIEQPSSALTDPVAVSTTIAQTIKEAGLKRAVVSLPKELGPNSTAFSNTCPEATFRTGGCPDNTVVGTAKAASPLQAQALEGPVILITNPTGGLPSLGLDLRGSLALKLIGTLALDASDPQALRTAVTFDGLPDIPISEFTLTFGAGEAGLNLATRSPCSSPPFSFHTNFLAHSAMTADFDTNADATCGGGSSGKKPKAKVTVDKLKSGHPTLGLSLRAGSAKLKSAGVTLPPGLKVGPKSKLKRGAAVTGGSLKGKGNKLKLKAKGGGVDRFRLKLSKGAVSAKRGLKVKQLKPFKLKVRDAGGKTIKLVVGAK